MAASTKLVNPNAEVISKSSALMVNISAARGLQQVLKSNLGARPPACFASLSLYL